MKIKNFIPFFFVIILLSVFNLSCSGEIIGLNNSTSENTRYKTSVEGEFCTVNPNDTSGKVKILFIVDTSGSMSTSDPYKLRQEAVENIILNFIDDETYEFGIIRYPNTPMDQTGGFTRDMAVITPAINSLSVSGGSTPIDGALNTARTTIIDDINSDSSSRKNSYLAILLSDGAPNDETAAIVAAENFMTLTDGYSIGKLVIHATYLDASDSAGTRAFMQQVAEIGGGDFLLFQDASDISFESFDYAPIKISYQMKNLMFLVINTNAKVSDYLSGKPEIVADSDGDGLLDEDELFYNSDPLDTDTDNDGCSDFIETLRSLDPTKDDCSCDMELRGIDTDGDKLYDCEEEILFTDKAYFDSDEDGIIDSIEVLNGMDPLNDIDKYDDDDSDGREAGAEIKFHTNPFINDSDLFESKSYAYNISLKDRRLDGVYCYSIKVSNVSIVETLECADNPDCTNRIEFYVIQEPQDDSEKANILTTGSYDLKVYSDNNGTLDVNVLLENVEFSNNGL